MSMQLTIVGCSGSYPGPDSPASCYLVQAEHEGRTWNILMDLGNGALGALHRYVDPLSIDAVLLSPNATDIQTRLQHEMPMLPLDGLFSQAGEVFFKVENTGDETFNLTVPYTYIHSPYL